MRLYFASPLFNAAEVDFNARLAAAIEELGYQVYLPQRDGYEAGAAAAATDESRAKAIFDLDLENVLASDVLLCILDGPVPDEGVALELGIGYADRLRTRRDRHLIGFLSDWRHRSGDGLNAMLLGALDELHHDEDALLGRLRSLISG